MKLGGELVGYSICHNNGNEETVTLEKPIKNTITKNCLNNLLMFNGSNALGTLVDGASLFISCGSGTRTGVFNYCAYGSSSAGSSVDDTDLKQRTSNIISTKQAGQNYLNCSYFGSNGIVKMRVSHKFPAASNDTTIREIGWFHKVEPSGDFTLSARVNLNYPIELVQGEVFSVTYQLTIILDSNFSILKNVIDGFDVRKRAFIQPPNTNTWNGNTLNPIPTSGKDGIATILTSDFWSHKGEAAKYPVFCINNQWHSYDGNSNFRQSWGGNITPILKSFSMPDVMTTEYQYNNIITTQEEYSFLGHGTITIKPYTLNSFYRDYVIVEDNIWAENRDMYGYIYNGEIYQFGHEEDGTFTPAPFHKDTAKTMRFTFRQSWSTDLLHPSA